MTPSNLGYSLREAGKHFRRNWSTSFGGIITIFLSLFIIGLFAIGSIMVSNILGNVEDQVTVQAFVDDSVADEDFQAFADKVSAWDNVKSVRTVSKEEAWADYSNNMSNNDAEDVMSGLDNENPLPRSVVIEMDNPEQVQDMVDRLSADEDFKEICDGGSENIADDILYGQQEVEQLFAFTTYVRIAAVVLVALLTFVAFIFINNTIRLSITARRREIGIMRLVGASNGFIRGPFVTEGVLQAVIGALLAIGVLELLRIFALPRLAESSLSFLNFNVPIHMYLITYGAMILIGLVIGLFGSAIAMRRYLKI